MNATISWGAPNTLRPRGKHRLTLKQRLTNRSAKRNRWTRDDIYLALVQVAIPGAVRWGAEELRRAQPKHNAKKAARTGILAAVAIPTSLPGYKPALVATGLVGAILFAIGGLW